MQVREIKYIKAIINGKTFRRYGPNTWLTNKGLNVVGVELTNHLECEFKKESIELETLTNEKLINGVKNIMVKSSKLDPKMVASSSVVMGLFEADAKAIVKYILSEQKRS